MKLHFSAAQARIKTKKSNKKDLLLTKIFGKISEACESGKYSASMSDKEIKDFEFSREVIKEVEEVLHELKYKAYFDFPGLTVSWKEE